MPQPRTSDIHVNKPLTNVSVAFIQDRQKDYVADKVFPMVPVQKQSDLYFTYEKGNFYRDDVQERAPGTESAGSGYNVNTDEQYFCKVYALHDDVDDQSRANSDQPLNPDKDATEFVTHQIMLKREKKWFENYFTTSIWTGSASGSDVTPSTLWDVSTSTPIEDIDQEKEASHKKTGHMPNTIVASSNVFRTLKNHPDIIDRVKYTQTGLVTEDMLAGLFGVEKFLVARGIQNTAKEGQTDVMSYFADKDLLLCYANPRPALKKPSAGYMFTWNGFLGAGAFGNRMKKFRMEHLASDRIEGEIAFDPKLVCADCGVFFNNVIS